MIETIEEGLERYKNELREYVKWIIQCRECFGTSYGIPQFDEESRQKYILYNNCFRVIQKVLKIGGQIKAEIETEIKG